MSNITAFEPQGECFAIDLTQAASTPVRITPISTATPAPSSCQYLIDNSKDGNDECYVWLATASNVSAEIPANGNPGKGIHLAAGTVLVLTGPPNAYISGICNTGDTGTIYVTPGTGL